MDEYNKPVQEKSTKKLFIDEIERRHISKLVHFTTNLNLCSIFKEKFISGCFFIHIRGNRKSIGS